MAERPTPQDYPPAPVPPDPGYEELRRAAAGCRACDLYEDATQVVVGEGPRPAPLMLVGEQPGDQEDRQGHPFVGPAGKVLDQALEEAGIDRGAVYVTNVVKHFRHELRGKRRIHQRPDRWHVRACLPWLHAELELVAPEALVCLGATAAQALLGPAVRVSRDHGVPLDSDLAPVVSVTTHPSAILRMREREQRRLALEAMAADLAAAHAAAGGPAKVPKQP